MTPWCKVAKASLPLQIKSFVFVKITYDFFYAINFNLLIYTRTKEIELQKKFCRDLIDKNFILVLATNSSYFFSIFTC